MKQQHSRALEPPAVDQVQLVDQASVVFLQQLGRDALTAAGALAKALHRGWVQVGDRKARNRHAIPATALFAQQKRVECRTLQLLLGGTAAVVVLALVADRVRVRLHSDFHEGQLAGGVQVHVDDDAKDIADLVRDFFEQARGVGHADDLPAVALADDQLAAVGVGKGAHPAQVLVAPEEFIFDVLVLGHSG